MKARERGRDSGQKPKHSSVCLADSRMFSGLIFGFHLPFPPKMSELVCSWGKASAGEPETFVVSKKTENATIKGTSYHQLQGTLADLKQYWLVDNNTLDFWMSTGPCCKVKGLHCTDTASLVSGKDRHWMLRPSLKVLRNRGWLPGTLK